MAAMSRTQLLLHIDGRRRLLRQLFFYPGPLMPPVLFGRKDGRHFLAIVVRRDFASLDALANDSFLLFVGQLIG